jgi:hypothetical protein
MYMEKNNLSQSKQMFTTINLTECIHHHSSEILQYQEMINELKQKHPTLNDDVCSLMKDPQYALRYIQSGKMDVKIIHQALQFRSDHHQEFNMVDNEPLLSHIPHRMLGMIDDVMILEFQSNKINVKKNKDKRCTAICNG